MPANTTDLEKRLWGAADELRANSKLKSSEYSVPVLGLIFLRYADHKFAKAKEKLTNKGGGRRTTGKADYQAQGVLFLPENARFSTLLNLPEGADIGKAINDAMKAIEADNDDLKDVLPRTYNRLDKELLVSLLKNFAAVLMDIEGDAFGKIYEYFLGKFAMTEGQKGGEFFTPTSIVKLIVEIIEPFHGRIYDPACGSGGMFVQSAAFVEQHREVVTDISIYGQEKVAETIRLCKMNLAVHGLAGDIRQAVTYYEDIHKSVGKFDFVMANPPFNVDRVDKERLKDDPRYPFGLPKARGKKNTKRKDQVLFIDARHIFRQIDRAHREFTPEQVEFIANIVRLYRAETVESVAGSRELMEEKFPASKYADVLGLCKAVTISDIEGQGWSLNPGRYVGVAERAADDFEFGARLEELNEELETLNAEARRIEEQISQNVASLLGASV